MGVVTFVRARKGFKRFSGFLTVDSLSILFNHRSLQKLDLFPWASGGFLERFGSLEGMEMEGTPRFP